MILGVPHFHVQSIWLDVLPFVEEWLEKSGEHRWSANDILSMLEEQDMQLWVTTGGRLTTIVLTQIINYPQCRECNIFVVSGTLQDDWRACVDDLVTWAAESGCHYISAMARPGFAKAVGWGKRETYIVRAI